VRGSSRGGTRVTLAPSDTCVRLATYPWGLIASSGEGALSPSHRARHRALERWSDLIEPSSDRAISSSPRAIERSPRAIEPSSHRAIEPSSHRAIEPSSGREGSQRGEGALLSSHRAIERSSDLIEPSSDRAVPVPVKSTSVQCILVLPRTEKSRKFVLTEYSVRDSSCMHEMQRGTRLACMLV
jgi:hypothetical protein